MASLEKTVKIPVAPGEAQVAGSNLTPEQELTLELAKKSAQMEDEKRKAQELARASEQLQQSLLQEQERSAQLDRRVKELEAAQKNAITPARVNELEGQLAEQKARVNALTEALEKITSVMASIRKS